MNDTQPIVPFISLDEAVLRVYKKFQHVVRMHGNFIAAQGGLHAARIECGMELLALRTRIEAGEAGQISWWAWYETKFTRSRQDAEKIMALASEANPQAAYEAAKARNAEINRTYRQRKREGAPAHDPARERGKFPEPPEQELLPPEPSQQDIEDRIVDLFRQLHRTAQVRCAVKLRKILQGRA
jgi:hypothetical protein